MLNNLESILLVAFKSGVEICMGYVFLLVILALAFNYEVNKGQFKDQILGVFTHLTQFWNSKGHIMSEIIYLMHIYNKAMADLAT